MSPFFMLPDISGTRVVDIAVVNIIGKAIKGKTIPVKMPYSAIMLFDEYPASAIRRLNKNAIRVVNRLPATLMPDMGIALFNIGAKCPLGFANLPPQFLYATKDKKALIMHDSEYARQARSSP